MISEIRNVHLTDVSTHKFHIKIDDNKIEGIYRWPSQNVDYVIDADGLLALPGLIDPHVHFRTPGEEHKEDWEIGSWAALHGGITTVFDMPNNYESIITAERLAKKAEAIKIDRIDYRFWFGATADNSREIRQVAKDPRVIGVKMYMGSSTGDLLVYKEEDQRKICEACFIEDLILAVHAEDEEMMRERRKLFNHEPKIHDHCVLRDALVELSAVRRALKLQKETGVRMYFCHISTPEALEAIQDSKASGAKVYVEVCPHHLFLDNRRMLDGNNPFFKMNPPLRSTYQMMRMRELVCRYGFVDCIGDDHAPHTKEEKNSGSYDKTPSGVPGLQTTLPLMFEFVRNNKMSISRLIDLTSLNASRIFRLPNKEGFGRGNEANIILAEFKDEKEIRDDIMRTKCRWTPFSGERIHLIPKKVITGGNIYNVNILL